MLDKKITYRDPQEREISGIIDLTEKPEVSSKATKGNLKGRDVEQIDDHVANSTVKKIKNSEKKGL